MTAAMMPGGVPTGFDSAYGHYGGYWPYRALGAPIGSGEHRPMPPRPDVRRGLATAATEDLAALVPTGDNPTVLAFVLGRTADRVVFDALNRPDSMTLVFRAAGPDGLAAVNRALDAAGFPADVPAASPGAPAQACATPALLAGSLAGRAAHDAQWAGNVAALLAG
jgi:hypothetical protein